MTRWHVWSQRYQKEVAPADCWNWGEWGLKEYKWKGSFLDCFVGLVVPVQEESFILPWLRWWAQYKMFFPRCTLFQIMFPHRPSTLGRLSCRAGYGKILCIIPDFEAEDKKNSVVKTALKRYCFAVLIYMHLSWLEQDYTDSLMDVNMKRLGFTIRCSMNCFSIPFLCLLRYSKTRTDFFISFCFQEKNFFYISCSKCETHSDRPCYLCLFGHN